MRLFLIDTTNLLFPSHTRVLLFWKIAAFPKETLFVYTQRYLQRRWGRSTFPQQSATSVVFVRKYVCVFTHIHAHSTLVIK